MVPDTLDPVPPADAPVLDTSWPAPWKAAPLKPRRGRQGEQLDVEPAAAERGNAETLLDPKYSLLGNAGAVTGDAAVTSDVFRGGDQQVGVGFETPLLLRRERGS